ncbi:hypothetical protein ACS0PU_004186 [Formica fusca]
MTPQPAATSFSQLGWRAAARTSTANHQSARPCRRDERTATLPSRAPPIGPTSMYIRASVVVSTSPITTVFFFLYICDFVRGMYESSRE